MSAQQNHLLHTIYRSFKVGLNQTLFRQRVVAQVHGTGRGRSIRQGFQLLVKMLRQKRRKGRHQLRQLQQHFVERAVGGDFVRRNVLAPESPAIETDIPIGQIFDKAEQLWHHVIQPVGFHLTGHIAFKSLQPR